MRFILLLVSFIIFTPFCANARTEITGGFSCTVKEITSIIMEEGKASKFEGFANHMKKGDTFNLVYNFVHNRGMGPMLHFELETYPYEVYFSVLSFIHRDKGAESSVFKTAGENTIVGYEMGFDPEKAKGDNAKILYRAREFSFSSGSLNIIKPNLAQSSIKLARYYKSDWHGILKMSLIPASGGLSLSQTVVGIDCRHNRDKFEEILTILKKLGLVYG